MRISHPRKRLLSGSSENWKALAFPGLCFDATIMRKKTFALLNANVKNYERKFSPSRLFSATSDRKKQNGLTGKNRNFETLSPRRRIFIKHGGFRANSCGLILGVFSYWSYGNFSIMRVFRFDVLYFGFALWGFTVWIHSVCIFYECGLSDPHIQS